MSFVESTPRNSLFVSDCLSLSRSIFAIQTGMGSAIHDLQRAIVAGQNSLTQLLRQVKLIAANLNLVDVQEWVDLELSGYSGDRELPKYRYFKAQILQYHHPMYGWQMAGHINITVKAQHAISEIEGYASKKHVAFAVPKNFPLQDATGSTGMVSSWPQRYLVSGMEFRNILNGVTNDLLNWTTELQKRGIKGENMSFNEKEKQAAASQIFNIGTVHGAVGNVNNSPITFYDNKTINQILFESNMPKQDKRDLEDVFDELKTAPPEKKLTLVEKGEKLIVKHKETLGALAETLGSGLRAYMDKKP